MIATLVPTSTPRPQAKARPDPARHGGDPLLDRRFVSVARAGRADLAELRGSRDLEAVLRARRNRPGQ